MDIETLKTLGINPEELKERVIDQAVYSLLNSTGFDPENEVEVSYESAFKREIEIRIQKSVDAKIAKLAEVHLLPKIGEFIEKVNMQKTNQYGEKKGDPMTFIEYIAYRADSYMKEDVDYNGRSKADLEARNESTYSFKSAGPRLTVLMKMYIQQTLEAEAKKAVNDVNKVLAENIKQAAVNAITSAANDLKINISAK